jgi:hypothetical protein
LLSFTKNFMSDRTLMMAAIGNSMSSFKNIENGVPQEAVLSVTLFRVVMAKICNKIEEPTKILGYADDRVFAICRTENALCEDGLPKSTEMQELNTKMITTRILTNRDHPIRHFFVAN